MHKLIKWLKQAIAAFEKIGTDIKELKNTTIKYTDYTFPASNRYNLSSATTLCFEFDFRQNSEVLLHIQTIPVTNAPQDIKISINTTTANVLTVNAMSTITVDNCIVDINGDKGRLYMSLNQGWATVLGKVYVREKIFISNCIISNTPRDESWAVATRKFSISKYWKSSTPTWQEVTEQGSTTTKPITISNQLNVNNLNSKGSIYVGTSENSQVTVGSAGIEIGDPSNKSKITSDGFLLGLNETTYDSQFFIDCGNKEVSGNDEMKAAFNKWLGLEQKKYDEWDFDWQFHPDLDINGFSVLKTGKQVMITAFLSINTTTETSFITLFKIPEELKGDQNIQFINQLISIPRYGKPGGVRNTLRELEYACHEGYVSVSNAPLNGIYDDINDFNQCEFRISLTYSME